MAAITCARAPQVNELARLLSRTAVEKLGSNVLKRVLFELPIAVDAQDGAAGATPCRAAGPARFSSAPSASVATRRCDLLLPSSEKGHTNDQAVSRRSYYMEPADDSVFNPSVCLHRGIFD